LKWAKISGTIEKEITSSLLQDDVAELRNQNETSAIKFKLLQEQHAEAQIELEHARKEHKKWSDLAGMMDQVESNGQSYLKMMQQMREQLG
jgi:hypothetical protein